MRNFRPCGLALLLSVLPSLPAAQAQDWPAKQQIRVIVPLGPGSAVDIIPRTVMEQVSQQIGQSIVIENKGGAGSIVGTDLVAKAEPDGYTLLVISSSFVTSVAVYPKLPFDYKKDFTAVAQFASGPANLLVVSAAFPGNTLKELLELAKNRDKPVTYGSPGIGSVQHFVAEMFNMSAGVKLSHIPYKGQSQTTADLISGQVSMTFGSPVQTLPLITAKKVKALGVSTSARYAPIPDVPTIEEAGLRGYVAGTWHGALAPNVLAPHRCR